MPTPLRLEDFGATTLAPRPTATLPDLDNRTPVSEEQALAAFDKGYAAGWEDATKAARSDKERMETAMANNLEDLGFTYHEARAHVMRALTPLLTGMLTKLLPRLIRDTLGARILDELDGLADSAAATPIDLMVPPSAAEHFRAVVAQISSIPLKLVEEESVPEGQIFLRIGHIEREIDLAGAMASITEAIEALDSLNKETVRHG